MKAERRHPACKNGKPYNAVALFPLYAGRMPALHFPFNLQTKKAPPIRAVPKLSVN